MNGSDRRLESVNEVIEQSLDGEMGCSLRMVSAGLGRSNQLICTSTSMKTHSREKAVLHWNRSGVAWGERSDKSCTSKEPCERTVQASLSYVIIVPKAHIREMV
jgi:hypothetical protein